jgi:N-hydroxyarylamine O-acetyltransferase
MRSTDSTAVDLAAYFARVDFAGEPRPDRATLEALHLAHATHIPFENLDVLLGRPIRLDLPSLQRKLVHDRRGGYCFEQNLLFAAVLEQIGFVVTRLAARVRFGADRLLPRTHMLMRVDVGGDAFAADVGFGGAGLLLPVPLTPGEHHAQFAWSFRIVQESDVLVLQDRVGAGWRELYAFNQEPQHLVDYEVANHFTSTHPDSIFVRTLTAQRPARDVRHALRGRRLISTRPDGETRREITDDDELLRVLAQTFGLSFPTGTRFHFGDFPANVG